MTTRRYLRRANGRLLWPFLSFVLVVMLGITYVAFSTRVEPGKIVGPGLVGVGVFSILLAGSMGLVASRSRKKLAAATARASTLPCLACGHTLTLEEPRCPECGVVVDADEVRREWAGFRKRAGIAEMER